MIERTRSSVAAAWVFAAWSVGLATPALSEPELRDLSALEELRERFEADRGRTRLVLLLSPT